jgi:hypothetical protein
MAQHTFGMFWVNTMMIAQIIYPPLVSGEGLIQAVAVSRWLSGCGFLEPLFLTLVL